MKLLCKNVIKDFSHVFVRGSVYESEGMKDNSCLVTGDHPHKRHGTWQAVKTTLGVTVLGIATFTIIEE
ncbi:hypothetical protein CPL00134L_CDS0039 [Escherichia phage Phagiculus]